MKMRIRVSAEKAKEMKTKHEEMGMGGMIDIIPTDLYGNRTIFPKGINLKEVEKDIHEVHGY